MDWTGERRRSTSSKACGSSEGSLASRSMVPGASRKHSSSATLSLCPSISGEQLLIKSLPAWLRRCQVREVLGHFTVGGVMVLIHRTVAGLADGHIGPPLEAVTILDGYAHEFRDHDDRQRVGQLPIRSAVPAEATPAGSSSVGSEMRGANA